ncbi:MAG: peptide deformylase [Candidatus Paceibacterota bacterium]|jgi:peptide deformylase
MKEIVQDGAEVLREIAQPVPENLFGTPELARIIKDMEDSLDPHLEGVALAAPQIGISYRIFIIRKDRTVEAHRDESGKLSTPRELPPEIEVFINPEILKTSRRRAKVDEGCLSVHQMYGTTKRHERATVRARRADGTQFEKSGGGLIAQIFEHEIDHLNGILFTDHAEHVVRISNEHAE